MNKMEKDYSKLEGKEIIYKTTAGKDEVLVVAGCDPDIGLTLYKKGDKEDNRICLTGPMSPINPAGKTFDSEETGLKVYKAMFDNIVSGIEKGTVSSQSALDAKREASNDETVPFSYFSDMNCAFRQ